jgi:hypothetical protein
MTRRQRRKMKRIIITITALSLALVAVVSLQVGLSVGYERGFNACIEENNLYERYE